MAPFPIDIGGAITGAAGTAVDGATGAAETATDKAVGAEATATSAAGGAVSTATGAVGDAVDGVSDTAGLLKWLDEIQNDIDKIEGYWNEYKNLIIMIFALIVTIYVLSVIYCCYHCFHDFFRCCCCYVKCTYRCERWCWRHRGPCVSCCKNCCNAASRHDYHRCSRGCLRCVPKRIRQDLEKQHGDLRKGWSDPTYMARACGRHELPEEPMARARWHWWGHEDGYLHRVVVGTTDCLGTTIDKEKKVMKEMSSAAGRDEHFRKLMERASKAKGRMAAEGEEIKARINREWAERQEMGHLLDKKLTKAELKLLEKAEKSLKKKVDKEGWGSDTTATESASEDEKPRKRGGRV